jgi:uncharacterized protein (TIGR01244 family)
MRRPSKRLAFAVAVLAGAGSVLAAPVFEAARKSAASAPTASVSVTAANTEMHVLVPGILVASQINSSDLSAARERGVKAVIGMRPDGEEIGQPTASILGDAARMQNLRFAYVPVPHGEMPDTVVDELTAALSASGEGPILLYCRSGRRAARAWALAEASRTGGLSPEEIESAVRRVGQPIDDLADRIRTRITARRS